MKNLIWWLLAVVLLSAGSLQSCGIRKTDTSILKTSEATKEENRTQVQEENKEELKKQETQSDTNDVVTEKEKVVVREKLDNAGNVIERTTSTLKSKKTDRSKKNRKSVVEAKIQAKSSVDSSSVKMVEKTEKKKEKAVEKSNTVADAFGGKWVMFGIALIIGVLAFFYWKSKK